jgi:hypothetical protein
VIEGEEVQELNVTGKDLLGGDKNNEFQKKQRFGSTSRNK